MMPGCIDGEGLRPPEKREAEDADRLEALRSAVAMSIEDIEAGHFKTFDSSDAPRKRVK
jgi:antitoxin ParD1/3/4